MLPPMWPRPTKPIGRAGHSPPFDRRDVVVARARGPAAPRIGSTWSGRRKPTIAPSTAGLRSVQATATAPGVVSCRSATARQPLHEREVRRELRLLEARVALAPVVVGQALDPLAGHRARSAGRSPSASRRSRRSPRARRRAGSRPRPRARSASRAAGASRRARSAGCAASCCDVEVRDADVAHEPLAPSARRAPTSPPRSPSSGIGQWIW